MLNGKFYTGLPPKMIDRSNSSIKNRQESHFFWPDDTDTDTALETRVKRRASLSVTPSNRPFVQKRNSDMTETPDTVDTKQMLRQEFAKSSIQFFDNICEEDEPKEQSRRRPLLRGNKQEIAIKPTATKLELPDTDTDTAAIKRKQAFESKVEFYDFVDEDLNNRNNMRKAKIDMNDKIEMEKNSKNSPKLQNKSNVHNYIENNGWRDNTQNNCEMEPYEVQRKGRTKSVETRNRNYNKYRRDQTPKRPLQNPIRNGVDYSDYPECRDEDLYNEASDHVDESFRHMQINARRPALKKRVSYSEEEEGIPVRNYYRRYKYNDDLNNRKETNQPKYRSAHNGQTRQQERECVTNNNKKCEKSDESVDTLEKYQSNNNNSNNNNNNSINKNNNILNMAQKHLRSSLCFHDGEIVASDNESTSTSFMQRRSARSATSRVSVGLYD